MSRATVASSSCIMRLLYRYRLLVPEDFEVPDDDRLDDDRLPEDRLPLVDGREDLDEEPEPTLDVPERLGDEDRGDTVPPEGLRIDGDEPPPSDLVVDGPTPARPVDRPPSDDVVGGMITGREEPTRPPVVLGATSCRPPVPLVVFGATDCRPPKPLVLPGVTSCRPPVVVRPPVDAPPEDPRPVYIFGR